MPENQAGDRISGSLTDTIRDTERRSPANARSLVAAEIRNSRTMLRRDRKDEDRAAQMTRTLDRLERLAERAPHVADTAFLPGSEGKATVCFKHFKAMHNNVKDA